MIYQNFQAYSDMAGPVRACADLAAGTRAQPLPGMSRNGLHRAGSAICELIARARLSHHRPAFRIDTVDIGGRRAAGGRGAGPPGPLLALFGPLRKEVDGHTP